MITYTNDNGKHTITMFGNGLKTYVFNDHWLSLNERKTYVFKDHRLSLHELQENVIYYLMAHDYDTGEGSFVCLTKEEFHILDREIIRGTDEASNFKKSLTAFNKRINAKNLAASLE